MRGFDPVSQLTAREAVRFIGTVGDVSTDVLGIYTAIISTFGSKEIRTMDELSAVVQRKVAERSGDACKPVVARNTVEVAAALGLLSAIPQTSASNKKYSLGESGRVVGALLRHPMVSQHHWPLLYRRALFEAHGDYLLQTLSAVQNAADRDTQLTIFTAQVRALLQAKVEELPTQRQGMSWDLYLQEVRLRRDTHIAVPDAESTEQRPTLETLRRAKKEREQAALNGFRDVEKPAARQIGESKTFHHQFTRCRGWLSELRLVQRSGSETRLTKEGARILSFCQGASDGPPARIAPSAALLHDAFQLTDAVIRDIWGTVVDDGYWERGLFDLDAFGIYQPTAIEFLQAVDWAFAETRVKQVSEASLNALRQAVFLRFLICEKPLRSGALDQRFAELFEQRGDLYGLGRNRQGRPAFVFKKRRVIG